MIPSRAESNVPPATGRRGWRTAVLAGVACAAIGLGCIRWAHELVYLSYDLLFFFRIAHAPEEVVVVYLDDRSHAELVQTGTAGWDRNLHAELVDRLTAARARMVVFDILLNLPATPEANSNLARAITANGQVVLAAALESVFRPQVEARSAVLPLPEFLKAAAGWGITEMMTPEKAVARQYYVGTETLPGLPRRAAELLGVTLDNTDETQLANTWLNYYGPALTLKNVSYSDALGEEPMQTFRDRVVFVGARPRTLQPGDEADAFKTPHTLWRDQFMPGVEIGATAFLNILRNDSLRLLTWKAQVVIVLLSGLLLGGIIGWLRPIHAFGAAVGAIFFLVAAAVHQAGNHVWFPWTVICFAQIPAALAWTMGRHAYRLKFEKEVLERTLEHSRVSPSQSKTSLGPAIPDHTLLRCVGRGAYGEVWLARNAIGAFHAVKIVQRRAFTSDDPFEREFRGLQRFMPISRSHPGFVNVLHVGRVEEPSYFFQIMEAADDETRGQQIDPEKYSPRTLARELMRRGQLPPAECVELGLALSLALEHLHRQQLVHRDIKPGNIIYVNGTPKLADIGLVADQAVNGNDNSLVGTEGYIPPEGPGTASADIYALGKLLYEAAMGRDRLLFPEVPTAVWEERDDSAIRRLNEVIGKACASNPSERYASAGEMHAALLPLRAPS
ncbi:MAG TPA: serine/threonine-protein kinase [Verrucomicrobiae bacterium]|nr:serine/threonine-protein kinase [Verrucomicrobiae bacterium]